MANIKFNRKEFEKHVKLTPEIEDKITMMGTHFENADNENIEVEIGPNRPDLYSLQGFLRSFSSFMGKKSGFKEYQVHKPEKNFEVTIDQSVKNIRPFTACAIIKNLEFNDEKIKEIIDIQEKLHQTLGRNRKRMAIGIYPLEQIKLPIRFEARSPEHIKFQPLEFPREINGLQILQQHPTGREYAKLLEGKDKFPVFVDANNEILSMPPIINSDKTGKITEKTKEVFIECSGFDLELLNKTLNIIVTILADMGGEIYQMKLIGLDRTTPDLTGEKLKINIEDCNKLLGLNLNEGEFKKLIEKMGYNYLNKEVQIPSYRVDILHPHDVYEDIAIAYGYNNLVPEIPQISTAGEISRKEEIKKKISDILAGLDMQELSTLHLLTKEEVSGKLIEVEDSKSDYKFLRPNLLISMLKTLKENTDSEYPQKVFELGVSFERDNNSETGIKEKESLVIGLIPGNFTELKQILEYIGRMLGIEFSIHESTKQGFIEGRTGKILFQTSETLLVSDSAQKSDSKNISDNHELGFIGEAHPELLKQWHIKMPLVCLELDIEQIIEKLS